MNTRILYCCAVLALAPAGLRAQQTDSAAQARRAGPPVHRIATASAVSNERLRVVTSVRALSNGNVLVNDIQSRRVLLMDSLMHTIRIVLDSASGGMNAYGPQPGGLLPWRGDTTFFIDPSSYAMLVLDGDGNIVRTRAVWRTEDAFYFANPFATMGQPGADAKGRVVYRKAARPEMPRVRPPSGIPWIPTQPDSAFVVAADLQTRKLDTLGVIRIPHNELRIRATEGRGFSITNVVNPLPSTDEWALLPDGTVAFVRGRDYRIEYLHPDGRVTSSPKMPFDWQRLTDEDKQRLVDSTKTAQQKQAQNNFVSQTIAWVNQYGRGYPKDFKVPEGFVPNPGMPKDWILPPGVKFPDNYLYACPPGSDPFSGAGPAAQAAMAVASARPAEGGAQQRVTVTAAPGGGGPGGGGPGGGNAMFAGLSCLPAPVTFSSGGTPPAPTPRAVAVAEPADLPDYRPPFPAGSVRADMDGNLWIRTNPMKPAPDGPVFDVVNPDGELIDRIQLPVGYAIVGFGSGKIVYLSMRDATGIHVARVHLK